MDKFVGDDSVLLPEKRLEHRCVRIHARRKKNCGFVPRNFDSFILEFAVDVLCAADKSHRRHAVTAFFESSSAALIPMDETIAQIVIAQKFSTSFVFAPDGNSTSISASCGEWMYRSSLRIPCCFMLSSFVLEEFLLFRISHDCLLRL